MSERIRLTCESCNHVIKAPLSAAGKRGKCPYCHNSVYVPMPASESEEIPLSPADGTAEATAEELEREALQITSALRRERAEPQDQSAPSADRPSSAGQAAPTVTQVNDGIVSYLLAMRDSDLDRAEKILHELKPAARQAKDRIEQLMVDAMPPRKLRDLPEGLYQGFLRKLLEQL